jgi:hypothetical protein
MNRLVTIAATALIAVAASAQGSAEFQAARKAAGTLPEGRRGMITTGAFRRS